MTGLAWVAEAVLLGCLLSWRWIGLSAIKPAWARVLLRAGAGAAGGMGLVSCLFFLLGVLAGSPAAAMVVELALLAWAALDLFRRRGSAPRMGVAAGRTPVLLAVSAVLVVAIATGAIAAGWQFNPLGNWDAWAIWNLRARFLASGAGLASRAWSPALGQMTHPDYPMLVSALVGRCWAFSHSVSPIAPQAVGYAFFLALLALVGGGVAALRGPVLGLLAALVLAASPALVHEVPAQYADVPLACYFAGAAVFAMLDEPIAGGILAGFAAWTKDEGALFLVVFGAAILIFRRQAFSRAAAGAMPGIALLVVFKLGLAHANSSSLLASSLPGAAQRVTEGSRYGAILASFGRELAGLGVGWYHPVLPLAAAALALRFDRSRAREAAFAGVVALGLLAGYFGVYSVTSNDLAWQLQTSLGRLLVQVWPLLLLAAFACLRVPQLAAATPVPRKRKAAVKERRTRA
ncbi:MAG TPA: hypothetical protein VMA31_17975 [Bryobacteraceae bacterium]|nr:hypothetical protein [Bryobacteraceae bacterium]